MGNQLTGIAPSQIQPVEHYLTDLQNYEYDSSLGSTRFFKVARAKTSEGLSVVKVFVIHDPSLPLNSHRTKIEDIGGRLQGATNCLPFQKAVQSDKAALLIRQYVKDSLYDRISTRPFLNKIEKKWIAFQLLCALNQCHKLKVCHGDVKSENVMITSWNWVLLTDFASFKPTYLPEDNPSDFSYFFDTSRRRTCYLAPERFVESGPKNTDVQVQTALIEMTSSNEVKGGDLTPAMDIFSAGCVITELFTEGTPPFDFSQLLAYRNGEYSPWKVLEKVDDNYIRDLVRHMIKKDPAHRLSAEEYMIQQRGKAFPEYFYTFLKIYVQRFAASPILPPDDRINRIKRDFPLLVKNMCPCVEPSEENNGLVLIISLVCTTSRKLHFCNNKLVALQVFLDISKYVTSDVILDRIIPYMLDFAHDQFPRVRAEVIRVITQCLSGIQAVPRSDANVFPEYIFPNLSHLTQDPSVMVRVAYAENIAQLAETALRVLEMMQRSDLEETTEEEGDTIEGALFQASYDMELLSLQETIQQKVVTLLSDPDNVVKQSMLENGITRLCVFFGRQKANDVLLSHMITFLNDKNDWHLRGAFFQNIVGVAAYVGWQSSSILKPLLEQGLADPEEFVVHQTLGALQSLTELGLLQKATMQEFLAEVVPFLAHPGMWIRQGAVGFISMMARKFNTADVHCKLLPCLQPFIKKQVLQVEKEIYLLNALEDPVPRPVFDFILRLSQLDRFLDILQKRQYLRKLHKLSNRVPYPELDDGMSQIFRKFTSLGMTEGHEDKINSMKDYITKLHRSRAGSNDSSQDSNSTKKNGEVNIDSPGRYITKRHAELHKPKDAKTETPSTPPNRRKKKMQQSDSSLSMNAEWKSMFGSTESEQSSTSESKSKPLQRSDTVEKKSNTEKIMSSSNSSSSTGSFVTMTAGQITPEGSIKTIGSQTFGKTSQIRYHPCKLELRNLVHKKRDLYSVDLLTKDLFENIAWESRPPPSNWKPKGILVAHLQEHRAAVNRIQVSHDHSFFATASNDGTVKLWECEKLEGKSVANRSKQTLKNMSKQGSHEKCLLSALEKIKTESSKETVLSMALAEHLFSPLASGYSYILDARAQGKGPNTICKCGCSSPVKFDATGMGHSKVWHGYADIIIKDENSVETVRVVTNPIELCAGEDPGPSTAKKPKTEGEKMRCLVFCEGSLSLAAASDTGTIYIYKIDSGKASITTEIPVDKEEYGNIVDISHFDTGAQSVLAYATVNGYLCGLDLRSNKEVWKLKNDPKSGLITSFAVHHSQCWLALGTSSGTHVCWDLRFQLPITSIVHPTGARVRRLVAHPQEQSWIISATQGNNEVSMWDVETGTRQKVLWASPAPPLSQNQASQHSVYGVHVAVTDTNVFMLTGGSDMRARFWDVSYPANSYILAGAAADPPQQTGVSYRSRLIDGTEVIQETYTKKQVGTDDTPRMGPDSPPQGHHDIISDINLCQTSQCLVITASRDGMVKVWK